MVDDDTLRLLLDYDPETGAFHWKERERRFFTRDNQWRNWNGRYPGTVAGHLDRKGYRKIGIGRRIYPAHRLAWLYVNGAWPRDQIDHINGVKDDNRIANLRDVTNAENGRNRRLQRASSTGRVGVTEYAYHGRLRYVARIRVGGHLRHLGYFDTIEAAATARAAAEATHGFHPNHGSNPA